jgi:hypothetical protein
MAVNVSDNGIASKLMHCQKVCSQSDIMCCLGVLGVGCRVLGWGERKGNPEMQGGKRGMQAIPSDHSYILDLKPAYG